MTTAGANVVSPGYFLLLPLAFAAHCAHLPWWYNGGMKNINTHLAILIIAAFFALGIGVGSYLQGRFDAIEIAESSKAEEDWKSIANKWESVANKRAAQCDEAQDIARDAIEALGQSNRR